MPGSNQDYWQQKFVRNVARDAAAVKDLESQGWRVLVLWECDILRDPLAALERLIKDMEEDQEPQQYAVGLERSQILQRYCNSAASFSPSLPVNGGQKFFPRTQCDFDQSPRSAPAGLIPAE